MQKTTHTTHCTLPLSPFFLSLISILTTLSGKLKLAELDMDNILNSELKLMTEEERIFPWPLCGLMSHLSCPQQVFVSFFGLLIFILCFIFPFLKYNILNVIFPYKIWQKGMEARHQKRFCFFSWYTKKSKVLNNRVHFSTRCFFSCKCNGSLWQNFCVFLKEKTSIAPLTFSIAPATFW